MTFSIPSAGTQDTTAFSINASALIGRVCIYSSLQATWALRTCNCQIPRPHMLLNFLPLLGAPPHCLKDGPECQHQEPASCSPCIKLLQAATGRLCNSQFHMWQFQTAANLFRSPPGSLYRLEPLRCAALETLRHDASPVTCVASCDALRCSVAGDCSFDMVCVCP